MLRISLVTAISLIFGAILGNSLAAQGITAENALDKYQRYLLGLIIALGSLIFAVICLGHFKLTWWIPLIIRLYFGEYFTDLVLAFGFGSIGLLVFLELPGRSSSRRMGQLFLALVSLTLPLSILLHYCLPIRGIIGSSEVIDGVVLQTTSYTCAPASIATLGRLFGANPNLSEKDVVYLTNTNRFGTSSLAEIRAMRQLGLNPLFQENLTIEDLLKTNQPAVLHVKENVNGIIFNHAVALLSIQPEKQLLTIANPLYGKQKKYFHEISNYWFGEAIFINPKE